MSSSDLWALGMHVVHIHTHTHEMKCSQSNTVVVVVRGGQMIWHPVITKP